MRPILINVSLVQIPPDFGGRHAEGAGVLVNPTGSFVAGGPSADYGLTRRKIIVDTCGGAARHGAGASSSPLSRKGEGDRG